MSTAYTIEALLSRFVEACHRQGLRVTRQRIALLRALAGTDGHPDAEALLVRVRRKIPSLALDTVYRTLRLLEARGVVKRVGPPGERARFDANQAPHDHFVCTRCGAIADLAPLPHAHQAMSAVVPPPARVEHVRVELHGVCADCAIRDAPRPADDVAARTVDAYVMP